MENYISTFGHYKLTKPVPNKSLEIAFLFIMHICKSAYMQFYVHEYSFNNCFFFFFFLFFFFFCKIHKKSGSIAVLDLFVFYV